MLNNNHTPIALITGAARRIGAVIAKRLHQNGYNVIIHYRHSINEAAALCSELNYERINSAEMFQADFNDITQIEAMAHAILKTHDTLDILVNNASEFFATPFGTTTYDQWQRLMNSNLTGSYFLTQALLPALKKAKGHIVNIIDANLKIQPTEFNAYCIAKSGLETMAKILKKDLAPEVKVSCVYPKETLAPEQAKPVFTPEMTPDEVAIAVVDVLCPGRIRW